MSRSLTGHIYSISMWSVLMDLSEEGLSCVPISVSTRLCFHHADIGLGEKNPPLGFSAVCLTERDERGAKRGCENRRQTAAGGPANTILLTSPPYQLQSCRKISTNCSGPTFISTSFNVFYHRTFIFQLLLKDFCCLYRCLHFFKERD